MSKLETDGGTFLGFEHEGGDEEEQSTNAMIIAKEDCGVVVRGEGGSVHTTFKPHQVSLTFSVHVNSLLSSLSRDNTSVNRVLINAKRGSCQGRPQLASPLTMTKGFEVLDGVKVDLSI